MAGSGRKVILLVDDDRDNAEFLRGTFEKVCGAEGLRIARDGEEAAAYLAGEKEPTRTTQGFRSCRSF
jgi:hypothetical protein